MATCLAVLLCTASSPGFTASDDTLVVAEGKRLATARDQGNCLACHAFDDGELPGNIGPPLFAMKSRFPDRAVLKAQVWDASVRNPETVMPPFGRHGILSDREIDLVVDYLLTL